MITANSCVKFFPSFETLIKYPNAEESTLSDRLCRDVGAGHCMAKGLLYIPASVSLIPVSVVSLY